MLERGLGQLPAVILFRHGQTDYNAARRFQGQSSTPLNDRGREQGRRTGELVANLLERLLAAGSVVEEALTSDLQRARDTASLVMRAIAERGLVPFPFRDEPALREFDIGDLQDFTVEEFERKRPGVLAGFYADYERDPYGTRYPGSSGESRRMLAERASALVRRVNDQVRDALGNGVPLDEVLAGDPLRRKCRLHLWSSHGGAINTILELMGLGDERDARLVGNGDVLLLLPRGVLPEGNAGPLAREMNCQAAWKIVRHYQVGDNVAAKINPYAVKVKS